jgi:hypothetical protein
VRSSDATALSTQECDEAHGNYRPAEERPYVLEVRESTMRVEMTINNGADRRRNHPIAAVCDRYSHSIIQSDASTLICNGNSATSTVKCR